MNKFELVSKYSPCGDQISAIKSLTEGVLDGLKNQVLLGVTGSGKTFTMANVINNVNRPALVIAHNKILAAQLCNEFKEFFPKNRVEFFVSYYDYYQPESYIPSTDTYIEKDMSLNDEIDKLRHSATSSLSERKDVIVVSSVSCIYGLGAPEEYYRLSLSLRPEQKMARDQIIKKLISIQYERNDIDFHRSTFRVRGDVLEIFPAYNTDVIIRVELFGDIVEKIFEVEAISGRVISSLNHVVIFPASHYAVGSESLQNALINIENDLNIYHQNLLDENKLVEAQRLRQRVMYDLEMMREMGYCTGIENYSRYFDGRLPGTPPFTLLDYFPKDFILFIDESHMTLPQIKAMYKGDFSRKENLVNFGFRLPAAYDNRPLKYEEFEKRIPQMICVSATPAEFERSISDNTAEQIIRPTGLVDPVVEIHKIEGQIDHLISKIHETVKRDGRVLVTTLTKRMSESLTSFLKENGINVRYMHSEIDTIERIEIVNGLRAKEFDVLVGINLLREGLDIPEVKLVAILDADKEGFLRSDTSLIQTIGRAARNVDSKVIMYADKITDSMKRAIDETNRRREKQIKYNTENNITPKSIQKEIKNSLEITKKVTFTADIKREDIPNEVEKLKALMHIASISLDFETAIKLRDRINELKKRMFR
ncbi:MAG: excinuclease ABC subunit UvrB [Firmicutes bacterium]|nr:excinuclease ABC subunit UvrB [Bacillota bacterium]